MSLLGKTRIKLLTGAAATATGTSQGVDVSSYENVTLYFKTNGNPGAGAVVIEEADYDDKSNTALAWSIIDTVDVDADIGTSSQYAYHIGGPGGSFAYHYIRVRISVAVTVATLDVVLVAV